MCAVVKSSSVSAHVFAGAPARSTHVANVCASQEDLRNRLIQLGEQVIPEGNETTLADSCQSLLAAETLSTLLEAHVTKTDANGTRAHEHDLVSVSLECHDGLDDGGEELETRREWGLGGDNGRGSCMS